MKQTLMPALFIGHGSPMNALETNSVTTSWQVLAQEMNKPRAIVVISAHWYISELAITSQTKNTTIHDFFGFPNELANYNYPSDGSPEIAKEIKILLHPEFKTRESQNEWGLDHGVWSILTHLYPQPHSIPILQLSIDKTKPATWHYQLGCQLRKLREQNILFVGSGNIVHNLSRLKWQQPNHGDEWAIEFDNKICNLALERNFNALINYESLGNLAKLSVPTPEHYLPLLYILGLIYPEDKLNVFNQIFQYGSLSMTSLRVG